MVEARVGPPASIFLRLELQACVSMLGTHLGSINVIGLGLLFLSSDY